MSRITRCITSALAAFALAAALAVQPATAQSASGTISATAEVLTDVNIEFVQDLSFGSHLAGEGTIQSTKSNNGRQTITGPDSMTVDVEYTSLPDSLTDGSGSAIPISFGSTSSRVFTDAWVEFDPATGITGVTDLDADGSMGLQTCHSENGGSGSDFCTVDVSGAPQGTYSATIESTVTFQSAP